MVFGFRNKSFQSSMIIGDFFFNVHLYDCEQHNLNEWIQLDKYEPDIHQTNIRSGRKFAHHTNDIKICRNIYLQPFFNTHLMNSVVVTNKIDRLTVTAASKQMGLKNEVAQHISSRRKEGRQVVSSSFVSRRLNTISIFSPFEGISEIVYDYLHVVVLYTLPGSLKSSVHDFMKY